MTAILILLKASLVIGVTAFALGLLGRRVSAASRHLLCTLAITGLLLLPMLSWALPGWEALQLTALGTDSVVTLITSSESSSVFRSPADSDRSDDLMSVRFDGRQTERPAFAFSWSTVFLVLYAAGVLLLLARLMAHRVSIHRTASHAGEMSDPEWQRLFSDCAQRLGVRRPVRLLRSREQTMPMAMGTRNEAILVPAVADTWSDDRRRAVLLHELAHIARRDCLTQGLAALVCAVYWVHPGVWWIASRLRVERELACDDVVLAAGADARDYAGHLLELAYALRSHAAVAAAVSMAHPRQLEGRLLALLDAARNRTAPARRNYLAGLAILAALIIPIAVATAGSAPPSVDTSSSVASEATEVLRDQDRSVRRATTDSQLPGTWEIRSTKDPAVVQIQFREEHGSHGFALHLNELTGLSVAQLAGSGGPVQFSLRRDAGTFSFEGVVRQGVGAGTFDFAPNDAFAAELVRRGLQRPTPGDDLVLARADIGFAFLDELNAPGQARPGLPELIQAAEHGVSLSYLREMSKLGYRWLLDSLLQARDHGVSPEFISGLRALGYRSLDLEQLITLRNHGVSPEYISGLRGLGYRSLDLDQLIALRNHGVGPEYIHELDEVGFRKLSIEALIDARNHGLSADYVRQLKELGYLSTLEDLKTLRNHGVDPAFIKELQGLGYTRLSAEELTGLRSHGVTAEHIRRANARFGTRLTVDRLKSLAANGWK